MLIKQIFVFHSLNIHFILKIHHFNRDLDYMISKGISQSQSTQSARLSIQSSELAPPRPFTRMRVLLPHLGPGGDRLPYKEGAGDPIPMMGQTLWYSRYPNPST
jgi:hypothetical protein